MAGMGRPHVGLLLFGIFLVLLGFASTLTGETVQRYRGMVYRADEPKRFWENVRMYYIGGVFFIAVYFYQRISN